MAKKAKTIKSILKTTPEPTIAPTSSFTATSTTECCDGVNEELLADILTAWDQWYVSDKNRNEFTVLTKAIESARSASKIGERVNSAKHVNRV